MYAKLSGRGTFSHRNDPVRIARIVTDTIAIIGANRPMSRSNFPIEKLWTSHSAPISACRHALAGLAGSEPADIFWNVAHHVYRLE